MATKKEVTAKRGQTVKIKVNRKARVRKAAKKDDRRYGPPPALDPTRRPVRKTTVYLLDSSAGYSAAGDPVDTEGTAHAYKPEEFVFPDPGGFVDGGTGATIAAHRFGKMNSEPWYAPEFVSGAPKIRVKNPNTGLVFKTIFRLATLNKTKSDLYGVSFLLGSKANPIQEANGNFKLDPTPEQRLATVLAQIESQGETPELVEKRDNILLEIEELQPSNYTDKLRWDDPLRDWAVPTTRLEAKGSGNTWQIAVSAVYFEPFNPFDTENYKVTQGSFGDEEVPAPRLNGKDILYVLLTPQTWYTTSVWDGYTRTGANIVEKRHFTVLSTAIALTAPAGLTAHLTSDSQMRDTYPVPPSQYNPIAPIQTIWYTLGGYEPITFPVAEPAYGGPGPSGTPQAAAMTNNFPVGLASDDTLVSNTNLLIEAGNTPAESPVGAFYFKDQFYNVYRKTVRVNPLTTLIYNGRVDGFSNSSGELVTGENFSYSWFDTFYPGHSNSDLGSFVINLRP